MLYNTEEQRIKQGLDCAKCPHFDKPTKTCKGVGIKCFEFDQVTQTCLDAVTRLPFNPKELNK